MKLIIPGDPIPKKRARHGRTFGGKPITYDSQYQQCLAHKQYIKLLLRKMESGQDLEIALRASKILEFDAYQVDMAFYLPTPKSLTRAEIAAIQWGYATPTQKPDLDNLEKFYLDIGNGILWTDDSKIIALSSKKYFCLKNPRTEINILTKTKKINTTTEKVLSIFSPDDIKGLANDMQSLSENIKLDLLTTPQDQIAFHMETTTAQLIDFARKYGDQIKSLQKIKDYP